MKINCPPQTKIKAWVEDRLLPEESTFIEGHLEGCDSCREIADQALKTPQWDKDDVTSDPPPIQPENNRESTRSVESRFRVIRPHAKGGLGEVFVAEDQELHREVALKEIQARFRNDASARQRFLQEGEITGRLEHPGIVPVYGLGDYPDGRPFYAMRFIKGETLKQAIECFQTSGERFDSVQFRRLLERFLSVCHAVAYAHSRGVLHRDIKPNNVMLGEFGETLLVDWGLAKVIGRPEPIGEGTLRPSAETAPNETRAGMAVGTPSYMSPEQAAGNTKSLGPPTDVYGLGAMLYCMLTGVPPITDDSLERLLEKVRAGKLIHPEAIRADVPKALKAICMKALAREEGNRYQKVTDLVADVERWLADEPIQGYSEPTLLKLRRWGRKRPGLSAGIVATILVSLIATFTSAIILDEKNRNLTEAKTSLEESNAALISANAKADRLLIRGREAVRSAFSELATSQKFKDDPSLQVLRKKLVEGASKFQQEFLDEYKDDPKQLQETFYAYADLSNWHGSVGSTNAALKYQTLLCEVGERLLACNPEKIDVRDRVAQAWQTLGYKYFLVGQKEEACNATAKAVTRYRELAKINPGAFDHLLAYALDDYGDVANNAGRPWEEFWEPLQEGKKIMERLGEEHSFDPKTPKTEEIQWGLAFFYNNEGTYLAQSGSHRNLEGAKKAFQKALDLRQRLAIEFQGSDRYDHASFLSRSLYRMACIEQELSEPSNALLHFSEAEKLLYRLIEKKPHVKKYNLDLADCLSRKCRISEKAHKFAASLTSSENGIQATERVLSQDSKNPQAVLLHEILNHSKAIALLELNRQVEALSPLKKAITDNLEITANYREARLEQQYDAQIEPYNIRLDAYLTSLIGLLSKEKKWEEAEKELRTTLSVCESVSNSNISAEKELRWMIAHARSMLGGVLIDQKRYGDAEPVLLASFTVIKANYSSIPQDKRSGYFVQTIERIVQLYERTGSATEADKWKAALQAAQASPKSP